MLLQFNVIILRFLLVGMLNTLLLLFLLLLLLHFDVSMLAELFLFGLLAFVQWLCCKCESINVSTFTFHSYELNTSNYYEPLTHNIMLESITSHFQSAKGQQSKKK
jgi:hypothetical protein